MTFTCSLAVETLVQTVESVSSDMEFWALCSQHWVVVLMEGGKIPEVMTISRRQRSSGGGN